MSVGSRAVPAAAFEPVAIASAGGALEAMFVPAAGMVCCSLRHRDQELLAQREGVGAYATRGATSGIPLLYPWANRLAGRDYRALGREVKLPPGSSLVARDPNGLPIHGAIAGHMRWRPLGHGGTSDVIVAELAWDRPDLLELFPFVHRVHYEARVQEDALTIVTTVRATGGVAVPVSFGFHPYLSLADATRASWQVELPVRERLHLDERMIPTGSREPVAESEFALDSRALDDAYAGLKPSPRFVAASTLRSIAVEFLEGYDFAQVYSPQEADFICFEPMTAPTNALRTGADLPVVAAGAEYRAAFRVAVGSASG